MRFGRLVHFPEFGGGAQMDRRAHAMSIEVVEIVGRGLPASVKSSIERTGHCHGSHSLLGAEKLEPSELARGAVQHVKRNHDDENGQHQVECTFSACQTRGQSGADQASNGASANERSSK